MIPAFIAIRLCGSGRQNLLDLFMELDEKRKVIVSKGTDHTALLVTYNEELFEAAKRHGVDISIPAPGVTCPDGWHPMIRSTGGKQGEIVLAMKFDTTDKAIKKPERIEPWDLDE